MSGLSLGGGRLYVGMKVRFQNNKTGKNLAVMPDDVGRPHGQVHANGGGGPHALFTVESNRGHLQFKNDSGHYLACKEQGLKAGGGGKWCDFTIIEKDGDHVLIKSPHGDWGVGFEDEGNARDPSKCKAGNKAQFRVLHENPVIAAGQTIRLVNKFTGKNLAIMPDDSGPRKQVHGWGGPGPHAKFTVEENRGHFQFKNEGGHYLAIKKRDGGLLASGGGGKWCDFNVVMQEDGNVYLQAANTEPAGLQWRVGFNDNGIARDPNDTKDGAHGQFTVLFE